MDIDWAAWVMIGALAALGLSAKAKGHNIARSMEYKESFYRAAEILISEDETPDSIVDLLSFQSRNLGSSRLLWTYFVDLLRGRVRHLSAHPSAAIVQFLQDVAGLRPELRKQWSIAMKSFVLALTYNHLILGPFIRRVALPTVGRNRNGHDGSDSAAVAVLDLARGRCEQAA